MSKRKIRLRKRRDRIQRHMIAGRGLCGVCQHWGTGQSAHVVSLGRLGMCWEPKSYHFKISVPGYQDACPFFEPIG